MKKAFLFTIITFPFFSSAAENRCAIVGGFMEQTLLEAFSHDSGINIKTIQRSKTTVSVLALEPVSEVFAEQMAQTDYEADEQKNGKAMLAKEDYFESYYANDARSITAKYIFTNDTGKRDVFVASSLQNKDECSVRFNGYLTLSRQF